MFELHGIYQDSGVSALWTILFVTIKLQVFEICEYFMEFANMETWILQATDFLIDSQVLICHWRGQNLRCLNCICLEYAGHSLG